MLSFNSYRIPILQSLVEEGGEASTNTILELVFTKVKDRLQFDDVSRVTSKEPVWRNRARWAKAHLALDGLVCSPERGVWKITKEGMKALKLWG